MNDYPPKGTRVKLVRCTDEYTRMQPGALGTITGVDSMGTVHVAWDDGARLGLCADAGDVYEVVAKPDGEGDALAADLARENDEHAAAHGLTGQLQAMRAADKRALTVQISVRVPADADAANVAAVIMAALHVGLEGAADCGIDAPDPSDVELSFVDDAQHDDGSEPLDEQRRRNV